MDSFMQMLRRAHIQQLQSFFIDGSDLDNWYEDEDGRPYGQRIQEEERPICELLEQTFSDGKELDEAMDKLSAALEVNRHVYMEIGIRAGAILLFDLLRENPDGSCTRKKDRENKR